MLYLRLWKEGGGLDLRRALLAYNFYGAHVLGDDQIEDLSGFGVSIFDVGRKLGASDKKARDSIRTFLSSHGSFKGHAVLLIAGDLSGFQSQIDALVGKRVPLFVVSVQYASSANYTYLGPWATFIEERDPAFNGLKIERLRSAPARGMLSQIRTDTAVETRTPTALQTREQRRSRFVKAPQAAKSVVQAKAQEDPYRIVAGKLIFSQGEWRFKQKGFKEFKPLNSKFDHGYLWLKAAAEDGRAFEVCCRLHKSRKLSDIRLIGVVARVIKGKKGKKFGFIEHPLYLDNLYFNFDGVDVPKGQRAPLLFKGDRVAFRIGRKGARTWALRVYKL